MRCHVATNRLLDLWLFPLDFGADLLVLLDLLWGQTPVSADSLHSTLLIGTAFFFRLAVQ
jgi:hypothetical protein